CVREDVPGSLDVW
nr:immunoglobulin heavy chain junction region [Macaca mulatta]